MNRSYEKSSFDSRKIVIHVAPNVVNDLWKQMPIQGECDFCH